MADKAIVHFGENSPEQVAFKLMEKIADVEQRPLYKHDDTKNAADRKWILDTYAECIVAVKSPSSRNPAKGYG